MPGIGALKCGEFIMSHAEMEQTGEYVGKTQYKRITQQQLLGITGQPSYKEVIQDDVNNYYDEPITLLHNPVITEADLGIPHKYGTHEFNYMFNRMLAFREGVGDALAEGQAKFCYEYLKTPEAIRDYEMNGMRAGIHGFCPGFCIVIYRCNGLLSRITSTVNAADQRGLYHYLMPMYGPFQANAEEYGRSFANWEWTHAPQVVKYMQDFKSSNDLAARCYFHLGADAMGPNKRMFQRMHTAITGMDYDEQAEQYASESLWLLERSIQARQGHTRADDWLFDSVFDKYEQYGFTIKADELNATLDKYYELRGVDLATGLPRKSEYARLDLTDVANRLESEYGIALPA
jgi:aldehyde:ferredoxin oxidoreductase